MALLNFIRRHRLLAILVFLFVLVVLFYHPILVGIGQFLVVNQELRESDLIHPLGWSRTERVDYAAQLYQKGWGDRLYFTGNDESLPFSLDDYGELVTRYVQRAGVPSSAILTGPSTVSTYAEALAFSRLLERREDLSSALVVSSPFHMRRTRMSYRSVAPEGKRLTFVHVPWDQSENTREWWRDEDSAAMVISEYVKLVYYFFKYQLPDLRFLKLG
ncbi:MAG: YdcF family protein [Candidatus Bipolaricaulota bacterium]